MKKDHNRQLRRQRALERFTINAERAAQDPKYKARKQAELAALKQALGDPSYMTMQEINTEVKAARVGRKQALGIA